MTTIFDVLLWILVVCGVLLLLCSVCLCFLWAYEIKQERGTGRRAVKDFEQFGMGDDEISRRYVDAWTLNPLSSASWDDDTSWTCRVCRRTLPDVYQWNNPAVHFNYYHRSEVEAEEMGRWIR